MSVCAQIGGLLRAWKKAIAVVLSIYIAGFLLVQFQYEKFHFPTYSQTNAPSEIHMHRSSSILLDVNNSMHSDIAQYVKNLSANPDIHLEHAVDGHTGIVTAGHSHALTSDRTSVCIGGGITSSKLKDVTPDNIPQKFLFFSSLMPTFCKTASDGYDYHFYLAYDQVDPVFNKTSMLSAFDKHFHALADEKCSSDVKQSISIHFVQCSHTRKPAWAQNDAMMEGYLDNMEYFYRLNDDTELSARDWTSVFINTLKKYNPSRVGVVGPNHKGGNTAILTYDFVHKTHVDIHGFYYPRLFTDWWADDWVTKVYRPDRSTKIKEMTIRHTMKLGQRYKTNFAISKKLGPQLEKDKATVNRYIKYKEKYPEPPAADGKKVVSMSLYGNQPRYTMGAIRNAQILPIIFPGWQLRIYIPDPNNASPIMTVPSRIVNKLVELGARVVYVSNSSKAIPPRQWSFLVVDDSDVETFIIRSPRARLSQRDAAAVDLWLQNWQPFHCIRDHPLHANAPIMDDLWGGNNAALRNLLGASIELLLPPVAVRSVLEKQGRWREGATFLIDILLPMIKPYMLCHDSVTCTSDNNDPFPVARSGAAEYVGRYFDQHQNPEDTAAVKTEAACVKRKEPQPEPPVDKHLNNVPPSTPQPGNQSSSLTPSVVPKPSIS